MSQSFVAIDFETANSFRGSPCQIGLVRVIDGVVDANYSSLIKPPPGRDHFDGFNSMLHGIRATDVRDAPEMPEVMSALADFRGDLPLVAHNASFDMGVLRDSLDAYGHPYPNADYFCTLVLSRRVLDLMSYSLPNVASHFGIALGEHHRADADALACAQIAMRLADEKGASGLLELAEMSRVRHGRLESTSWLGCQFKGEASERFSPERLAAIREALGMDELNLNSEISGQTVVFTGALGSMTRAEAWARVQAVGGIPAESVTKRTNVLVFGVQDPAHLSPGSSNSSKYLKAEALKASGQAIEVLDELTFLRLIMGEE
jgi:DNA polymerase-3 subunit epsilon